MSKKTIEEKFISYQHEITTAFLVNDIVDKYGIENYLKVYQNQFLAYKAGYETAQKEMEERLKEAEECLKFYANPGHWGTDLPGMSTAIDPVDQSAASYRGANYDIRGGKRAREYFKKWGVE